ncbi:hypothetical protein BGZ51_005044 [Haplosporangium sp. Z 767]|nr:hypothetical protein BGZ51_005044 [Haplosporangium sp. Z 767]KAF9182042.1 hypothetical protein BGZ50_005180 [Haplosporangium sp. Z 11]
MVVSFRNLFISENQRHVEAEARNIGLAHTIRDLITGANHETHVDNYQKKKVVKVLQKADPVQVNELITILKAMPDPTVVEFKQVHSREASKQHHQPESAPALAPAIASTATAEPQPLPATVPEPAPEVVALATGSKDALDEPKEPTNESSDASTSEVVKAPSSWWAISFTSLMGSIGSPSSPKEQPKSVTTTTTTVTTITMTEEQVKEARQEAEAAEAAENAEKAKELEDKVESGVEAETGAETDATKNSEVSSPETSNDSKTETDKGTISKTTTSSKTVTPAVADKSVLVSTLNSIKKQMLALGKAPPRNVISAYTYWWGYEIYVPHKCMSKLQRVTNTSQLFFGFLSGAVAGIPGLAALVPLSRIISAWVGFQWAVIQAQDLGKGVVLSATWVLPVALAPRPWDHLGADEDSKAESEPEPKSKQKRIKAT